MSANTKVGQRFSVPSRLTRKTLVSLFLALCTYVQSFSKPVPFRTKSAKHIRILNIHSPWSSWTKQKCMQSSLQAKIPKVWKNSATWQLLCFAKDFRRWSRTLPLRSSLPLLRLSRLKPIDPLQNPKTARFVPHNAQTERFYIMSAESIAAAVDSCETNGTSSIKLPSFLFSAYNPRQPSVNHHDRNNKHQRHYDRQHNSKYIRCETVI